MRTENGSRVRLDFDLVRDFNQKPMDAAKEARKKDRKATAIAERSCVVFRVCVCVSGCLSVCEARKNGCNATAIAERSCVNISVCVCVCVRVLVCVCVVCTCEARKTNCKATAIAERSL